MSMELACRTQSHHSHEGSHLQNKGTEITNFTRVGHKLQNPLEGPQNVPKNNSWITNFITRELKNTITAIMHTI